MASKADMLKQAQKAGLLPDGVSEDDYTAEELDAVLNPGGRPAWKGSLSSKQPVVAPDGHVNLSKEDIANRG